MPYPPSEPNPLTRKANTPRRRRQWNAVYESSKGRGDSEGTAIAKASGVVKKDFVASHRKAAFLSPIDLAGRSQKRFGLAEKLMSGASKAGNMDRSARMHSLGTKVLHKSLSDLDRSGLAKRAMGYAKQAERTLFEHPSEREAQKGIKPERGDRPSSSIKDDGDSPLQPRTSKQTMDAA